MKFKFCSLLFTLLPLFGFAQESPQQEEIRIDQYVSGILTTPPVTEDPPLAILIQGSGPTDRDGNQSFMKNDSFKKLARDLAKEGIATFRYDKRIFEMHRLGITEEDMRFDDFVTDAVTVLEYFDNDERFGPVVIIGHSQGSLVGMLAARNRSDGFVSISGVSTSIDSVIVEQVAQQMPALKESTANAFLEMRESGSTTGYNPVLHSIFKPALQPFMLSWMIHHPSEAIQQLEIPVLIINGTKDLQVLPSEAKALAEANPAARLEILEKMNHVLVNIEGDDLENSKSYNEPAHPLHPELVPIITSFIQSLE